MYILWTKPSPFSRISPRNASTWKAILGTFISRHPFSFTFARTSQIEQLLHVCNIDAEPLYRYRRGGYHPIRLGGLLKDGRYKILHKLGWGGYSTVWAARDQRFRLSLSLIDMELTSCQRTTIRCRKDLSLRTRGTKPRIQCLACYSSDSI